MYDSQSYQNTKIILYYYDFKTAFSGDNTTCTPEYLYTYVDVARHWFVIVPNNCKNDNLDTTNMNFTVSKIFFFNCYRYVCTILKHQTSYRVLIKGGLGVMAMAHNRYRTIVGPLMMGSTFLILCFEIMDIM